MARERARRDNNFVTTIMGVDMSTGELPTQIHVDETTHRLLVSSIITSSTPLVAGKDFDYLGIVNTGTDEDTLTYKTGGASGTAVLTLVIGFASGAEKVSDNLSSLTYS